MAPARRLVEHAAEGVHRAWADPQTARDLLVHEPPGELLSNVTSMAPPDRAGPIQATEGSVSGVGIVATSVSGPRLLSAWTASPTGPSLPSPGRSKSSLQQLANDRAERTATRTRDCRTARVMSTSLD